MQNIRSKAIPTFPGQTFAGEDLSKPGPTGPVPDGRFVLVKYSWAGDMSLDGKVDSDDYFRIDWGYINRGMPANVRFANGDLNYGYGPAGPTVDSDDYFLIDKAYIEQEGILAAPAARKVAKATAKKAAAKAKSKARQARAHRRPQGRGHRAA